MGPGAPATSTDGTATSTTATTPRNP
jgi:hypothetical protein